MLLVVSVADRRGRAQDLPESLPRIPFHLTARPWTPLDVPRERYLEAIEGVCRFTIRHQDPRGAVIDAFLGREHQYSTPYFAAAVGTLIHAGRAQDLLENGVAAMEHATECFAGGSAAIPDAHGEFFLASLPTALELYDGHVPRATIDRWRQRLSRPRAGVVKGGTNNWRTYAMKGEWHREQLGLAGKEPAVAFVEDNWLHATQRDRILGDKWNLYQDRLTVPESHAVEAVGRGNLLALIAAGYDGPSRAEIEKSVERGTAVTLLLQDPSGQCAPDGRTDDHVFNDVLYQLAFEVMAERARRAGDARAAGQYRRAAALGFNSIARWQRTEPPWDGSYFITKNRFDPAERVGYQPASQYGNYNGAVMLHLAEAYLARQTPISEQPAPVEIGGYAFATDPGFASAVANAGGMALFAALRGDSTIAYDHYWTALGVERFGRVGWDCRLGPSDGIRDPATGRGVTFAPTWREDGRWVRLADVPDRYAGRFSVQFAHPLLVRCAIEYGPTRGTGPRFRHEFVVTPDGVLATLRSDDAHDFGVTWPLLEDDGRPLRMSVTDQIATTAYSDHTDEQCFLAPGSGRVVARDERLRSTYGWLRPVRVSAAGGVNQTFVYPRSPGDPTAEQVRASLVLAEDGFESVLGSVHGSLYVGRWSAGGEGTSLDCNRDGEPDLALDAPCRFVVQLHDGKITALETDRAVRGRIGAQAVELQAYVPVAVSP
jgi:hypothetical protein